MSEEQKRIHDRAQLIVDAAKAAPALTIDPGWTNSRARREVVRAVLGDSYAQADKSDDYIEACMQIIRDDGRVATYRPTAVISPARSRWH